MVSLRVILHVKKLDSKCNKAFAKEKNIMNPTTNPLSTAVAIRDCFLFSSSERNKNTLVLVILYSTLRQ